MKNRIGVFVLLACLGCEEEISPPEISIELSPIRVPDFELFADAGPHHFDYQLLNRGDEVLKIESVVFRGDQYCSFEFQGPDRMEVTQSEPAFIRGWYRPQGQTEDQIAMEVMSNSHIHNPLVVPICGRGVQPDADAGADFECQVPPAGQPDCVE